jgi:hypothetical protein
MPPRVLRCPCGEKVEILGAPPPKGWSCPKCRKPLGARGRSAPADRPAPAPVDPAARKRKLLILAGAGGGGVLVAGLLLFIALSKPSAPPPEDPAPKATAPSGADREKARRAALREEWERAAEAVAAARKDPALAERTVALLEKLAEKAKGTEVETSARGALVEVKALVPTPLDAKIAGEVRALVDQGQLRGATTLIRTYVAETSTSAGLRASLEALGRRIAEVAPARYEALLKEARGLVAAGKPADARLRLLEATAWGLPELAERAKREVEEITASTVVFRPVSGPVAESLPTPEPPKKVEKPAEPEPKNEEPAPAAAPGAGATAAVSTPGLKVLSTRAPRTGLPYAPGGMADADKQKKQSELAAEVRKEKKGAAKAAAAKRAEWLAQLEKEKGVYDVTTFVDKGDVARRVDVVIVTSGFPKADGKKVDGMCEQLKTALLKVDPFQNYPDYINFHRIKIDDKQNGGGARIPYQVQNDILTANFGKGLEYARLAPSFDLVVVLCNVSNVRATGGPPFITIDASLDLGRTFLHEMGHAFASLSDEYVDPTLAGSRPFREDPDSDWQTNVTALKNPKLSKWHYWTLDAWPAAHEMNRLPPGHKVGVFEGAAYQTTGVYRPEAECLMRHGEKYCVVCFEHVEKRFYRLIAPIDDARPRRSLVGLWGDESVVLEGDAIRTMASGGQAIGKFEGLWYLDAKPTNANSKNLTTALTVKAAELGAGVHEAALRVDFSNKRVRRDNGWLSSSIGWKIDVLKHKRPKWEGPLAVQGRVGQALEFEAKIQNPDAQICRVEVRDLPEGAAYEDGKVRWTPSKAQQGAWRPRFTLTDGLRSVERAVEISVLDVAEKNFEPVFSLMEPVSVSEGEALELALEVVDVDGDNLVFTSPNLPEGAELDVHDGVIRWKPGPRQAGKYPGIQIEVFDGRRRIKGAVDVVVEDKSTGDFAKDDLLNALRSGRPETRLKALQALGSGDYARSFQYLEAARLLRDKDPEVKEAALAALKRIQEGADAAFTAMMIRDLEPHAWHFTDDKPILGWLEELAGKGVANDKDVKQLKGALKQIAKYNADRGA